MRGVGMLTVIVCAVSAYSAEISIAADRMLVADGQRTFVLGLYENPSDDAVLQEVADAGFNLVRAFDTASLDRLHAKGLHGWVTLGALANPDPTAQRESLKESVTKLGGHPALWAWEVPDEALWNIYWQAHEFRENHENEAQEAAIDALTDKAAAAAYREQYDEAQELYEQGRYAEAEAIADALSADLGLRAAGPGQYLSTMVDRKKALLDALTRGYSVLKDAGVQPVWMNHAPRNSIAQLAEFGVAADIVGCDIYPVPEYLTGHSDLRERTLAAVGAYTDRMQAAAPDKPVWMVLQAFGWADLRLEMDEDELEAMRRPNLDELRFMAYDAIVHGARGILYWGTANVEKDSVLWSDLLKVVREMADRHAVLTAPDVPVDVEVGEHWGSGDRDVYALAKDDGALHLIVVNELPNAVGVTLRGLDAYDGRKIGDYVVEDGAVAFHIGSKKVVLLDESEK